MPTIDTEVNFNRGGSSSNQLNIQDKDDGQDLSENPISPNRHHKSALGFLSDYRNQPQSWRMSPKSMNSMQQSRRLIVSPSPEMRQSLKHITPTIGRMVQRRAPTLPFKINLHAKISCLRDLYDGTKSRFRDPKVVRSKLCSYLSISEIKVIEMLYRCKQPTISNSPAFSDKYTWMRVCEGLMRDDYRYIFRIMNPNHQSDHDIYASINCNDSIASPLMAADIDRTLAQVTHLLPDADRLAFKHDLKTTLVKVCQSTMNVAYFQGLGTAVGGLLLGGLKCDEAFSAVRYLCCHTDMHPYFTDGVEYCRSLAELVMRVFFKRNLANATLQNSDFKMKTEIAVFGWLMNLFGNSIGITEYLSFMVLVQRYGLKMLVCMSLELLESSIVVSGYSSKRIIIRLEKNG